MSHADAIDRAGQAEAECDGEWDEGGVQRHKIPPGPAMTTQAHLVRVRAVITGDLWSPEDSGPVAVQALVDASFQRMKDRWLGLNEQRDG
jgi:hypothetical protein